MLLRLLLVSTSLCVLLATAGCGGSGSTTSTESAPPSVHKQVKRTFADVVAQVRSGVIRIEAATCDGKSIGTGILVGPRLVATVDHVVADANGIALKRNGRVIGRGVVVEPVMVADRDAADVGDRAVVQRRPISANTRYSCITVSHWYTS